MFTTGTRLLAGRSYLPRKACSFVHCFCSFTFSAEGDVFHLGSLAVSGVS